MTGRVVSPYEGMKQALPDGVFDPVKWAQAVCIRPTRKQFEEPFVTASFLQLKKKLQISCDAEGFAPVVRYHATVVIRGVLRHQEGSAMMAAVRVLCDSPIGFDDAISYTFHVQRSGGRPLIGLVASEEPLDSDSAVAHFVVRGDDGQ